MNFFRKLFLSEDLLKLENLLPGVKKLNSDNERCGYYLYNNYLIEINLSVWEEEGYRSYVFEESLSDYCLTPKIMVEGTDWCNVGFLVANGDRKDVFLAACKRINDIILAEEGF